MLRVFELVGEAEDFQAAYLVDAETVATGRWALGRHKIGIFVPDRNGILPGIAADRGIPVERLRVVAPSNYSMQLELTNRRDRLGWISTLDSCIDNY